ncbi:hypothetical protein [Comamonas endophytica]|uniref:DUF1330 domain-containing protein n=1 Tax=Comamonas endophytica TaxID=2949090 RepID=A0ABY6GFX5_9BURK|nr:MULTISPECIES: hypothetical protein [unclassified Acidovorax]MCD2513238.1 hypothetical protein [Acidovorax sp. D4N7]UYG53417.1 hypothetical protein M9799_18770 [Acidovorax sp. 5MLIR]
MNLVQLLLPLYDNAGQAFPREQYAAIRSELIEKHGGLTAYAQAPATGLWMEDGERVFRDEIVVYEVMVDQLDRHWWAEYRRQLEKRFVQRELVIRVSAVQML